MARKILVADDNPKVLEDLCTLLLNQGYKVLAVEDGEKAFDCASTYRPHLILLDINMPGRDGYQICSEFKSNPEFADIPVILTFSENEPFDPSQAKRAGASRCIPKSIDPDTLSTILESLWINLGIADSTDEAIDIDEIEPFDEEDEKIPKILAGTASVNSSTGTHYIFQIALEQPVSTHSEEVISQSLSIPESEENLLDIAEEYKCPECGTCIQPEDVICTSCGVAVVELSLKAVDRVSCTECGETVNAGDIFCLQCGTALSL